MDKARIITNTLSFVKAQLQAAEGGHDYWHSLRVWKTAKYIAKYEDCNLFVVELGALLHDIADAKFHNNDEEIGAVMAKTFLQTQNIDDNIITEVYNIVKHVSFKGGQAVSDYHSPELAIVQDADRLDALGAIGIARTFNYGGHKGFPLYDPDIKPKYGMSPKEYRQHKAPTINHFYEKLLLLADKMHTDTAKAIAKERHRFMEMYLQQFYKEWEADYDNI